MIKYAQISRNNLVLKYGAWRDVDAVTMICDYYDRALKGTCYFRINI